MAESQISNKIWNIAGILRDGGVSYGDYLEQITFLLFLKMVDENKKMANIDPELQMFSMEGMDLPDNFDWNQLSTLQGSELIEQYESLLSDLSKRKGMIGEIYRGARNKVEKASLLKKVVDMIDAVDWSSQSEDVKGDIYESLLQRIAQDTKSGAGQYFTPRALINVIVKCINPQITEDTKIADPCCGSGGFLLAARKYIGNVQSERLNKAIQESVFHGTEYVESTYRMCLMNLLLHGIGTFNGIPPIKCQDSLAHAPGDGDLCNYVLTNPPFGNKSAQTIEVEKKDKDGNVVTVLEKEKENYSRQDFIATTSNKQLNFVQHIKSMLKVGGQAAVVLPDNVLFEGNAGEVIRQNLLKTCDLHTILRLPAGIFYAQTVKANVLFFEKRPASDTVHTKDVWIYDYRTNVHHTLKQNPLKESDLDDFVACYNPADRRKRKATYDPETNPEGRWRKYSYDEVIARDKTSLQFSWIKSQDADDFGLSMREQLNYLNSAKNILEQYELDSEMLDYTPKKVITELLDLAVHGNLVSQNSNDSSAKELLDSVVNDREILKAGLKGKGKKNKDYPFVPVTEEEMLFDIPDNWEWCHLGDICTFLSRGKSPKYSLTDCTYPVFAQKCNLKQGGISLEQAQFLDPASLAKWTDEYKLRTGDVLVNSTGTGTVGRTRLFNESCLGNYPFVVPDSHVSVVRTHERICSEYIYALISSKEIQSYIEDNLAGSTNQKELYISVLQNLPVPLPPIEEQKRIADKLNSIIPVLEKIK